MKLVAGLVIPTLPNRGDAALLWRLHEGEILDPRWVERTCPACEPPATAMVPRCCHWRNPLAVYSVQDGLYQGYAAETGLPAATRGRRP